MLAVYAVAGKHKAPVNIHVVYDYKDEVDRALARSPDTTIIWAHVGDGPASMARALMKKHSNLYADLSTRNPYMKVGKPQDEQRLTNRDGSIQKDWKTVFEEFPDRFLYGLDLNTPDRVDQLDQVTTYYRSVLGQVSQATAEQIAYKNAKLLLGLK